MSPPGRREPPAGNRGPNSVEAVDKATVSASPGNRLADALMQLHRAAATVLGIVAIEGCQGQVFRMDAALREVESCRAALEFAASGLRQGTIEDAARRMLTGRWPS